MDAEYNHTFTSNGDDLPPVWPPSEDDQHQGYYIYDEGGEHWFPGPPPSPVQFVQPVQYSVFQPQFFPMQYVYPMLPHLNVVAPVVQSFEIAIVQENKTPSDKFNAVYVELDEFLQDTYVLDSEDAINIAARLKGKLNILISQNSVFCEFFGAPASRLLEIQDLLSNTLKAYKDLFDHKKRLTQDEISKGGYRQMVMKVYYRRKGHRIKEEENIISLYNEYRGLVYRSRCTDHLISTDAFGATNFIDKNGERHFITLRLFPSILHSDNFVIKEDSKELFKRKAGICIKSDLRFKVRWTGVI
jgi:hypothetical protein